MNAQDVTTTAGALATTAGAMLIAFGLRALGAIAVWFVGRWLIRLVVRLIGRALTRQHVDATLMRYLANLAAGAFLVVLRPFRWATT